MDIATFVHEYARKKKYYGVPCNADTVHSLIKSDKEFAFTNQEHFEDSEYIAYNIRTSVRSYPRDKKVAISVYKHFLGFLREKGVDVEVQFPPIDISNSFERLMFIAKYLQDERHNIADLPDLLWISDVTIRKDINKLLGEDDDPIQICGKQFIIDDVEHRRGQVRFASTAHPIFLTHNLSQVIVMLKGLKAISEDPLYKDYAKLAASDIWGQLSDYAKTRIDFVFSELLPEDLTWYKNLETNDEDTFRTERQCSEGNHILDCMKNGKTFYAECNTTNGVHIYRQCRCLPRTYDGHTIEIECTEGHVRLNIDDVLKTAYTAEGLL